MCLPAGNDLNEDITPIEAGLKWTIGKRRRDACDFLGGEVQSELKPASVFQHTHVMGILLLVRICVAA